MTWLERDLVRWENGELTLEDVETAHPDVGIRELVRVHTRLAMLRAIPMPDVEHAWSMTVSKLEDRGAPAMQRLRAWVRKPLIASFASVVMTGGAAYAAGVDPVERAVDRAWAGITKVVTRDTVDARDIAAENEDAGTTDELTTTETDPVVVETPPPGDDADGEHGKSKSKGNSADHRKDEANKHRGWVHKKDKKEKGASSGGAVAAPGKSKEPKGSSASASGDPGKDKSSAHTEAADDSGGGPAPVEQEPPAPPAPPATSNAGGNGKGKGKS
ncbi:MAG: hypothetical protein ACRDKT_05105 [Actinomycetota bacterium]